MAETNNTEYSEEERIRALLENINAYIEHFHGGSVEMVELKGKKLKVRLGGACLGCPLSPTTLHGWVAGTIHQFFPDIEVIAA
ncbi:MAG: NifU family protein [Anaerolineales bacterium]|jgi:Fe-S cluster biogenesis protein NfuA|nr:NifU family protein [Anaerolineales bacterium]